MALSWIYELLVKLTEVKVPPESIKQIFFSKNPTASSLSAKCTIALCLMKAKNNSKKHKDLFPFNSFPGNTILRKLWLHIISSERGIFVQQRSSCMQCLLRNGRNHTKTTKSQNFTFLVKYSFRTFIKALARSRIGVILDQLFLGNESQNRMSDTNFRTFLLN